MASLGSYICLLSVLLANFWSQIDCIGNDIEERCTTTEGNSGNCKVVRNCDYAMNIIKKYGINSRESQNILYSNRCGFQGHHPKVCCPQGKNVNDDGTSFQAATNPTSRIPTQSSNNNNIPKSPRPNVWMLLPRDCGLDGSNKIIGGEMTELGEFPWMAILEYQNSQTMQTVLACGGVLITKRYVLTAAHCIRAIPSYLRLSNVRLGEHNTRTDPDCVSDGYNMICASPMLSVPIENFIVHEGYMTPQLYRNDIALLRLAQDVVTTNYIRPICLPSSGSTSSMYWAAGWGAIETRRSSDVKLKVSLPYVDLNQCAAKYTTKGAILGDSQICAGGRVGKDTCKGDSGGPLMKQIRSTMGPNRWVVDGVVSIGHSPCGLPGWPGVYTKVYNYVPWILNNLSP